MDNVFEMREPHSLLLLLVVAFTIHNIEEVVLDLPSWIAHAYRTSAYMSSVAFQIAAFGVTLIAWAIFVAYRLRPERRLYVWLAGLVSATLMVNCLSHIGQSIVHRSLMPGVYSAVILLGPISAVALFCFARELSLSKLGLFMLVISGSALQVLIALLTIQADK